MRAAIIALGAVLCGPIAYDATGEQRTYAADWTFSGKRVIVERTSGKLGLVHSDRIVGFYLAGKPRLIGFGCEGADAPLIAMEEDRFPRCQRIEPVS